MSAWLTTSQIAERMGVSTRTVQRLARDREIPHIRVRGRIHMTEQQWAELEAAYTIRKRDPRPEADLPNPDREGIVVVPMRRRSTPAA